MKKGKKQVTDRCNTPRCKNDHAPGRRFCHTCRSRKKRAKDPVRYSYDTLKANAKRRNKAFELTFAQFKRFCRKTNYIAGKGRSKDSYTIDRKKNHIGYVLSNIRVITKSENSSKGTKKLEYDWRTRTATVVEHEKQVYADGPF